MTAYADYATAGYETGYADGWDGNAYNPYDNQVPADYYATYRINYAQGYEEGQDAYRRAMEGLVP